MRNRQNLNIIAFDVTFSYGSSLCSMQPRPTIFILWIYIFSSPHSSLQLASRTVSHSSWSKKEKNENKNRRNEFNGYCCFHALGTKCSFKVKHLNGKIMLMHTNNNNNINVADAGVYAVYVYAGRLWEGVSWYWSIPCKCARNGRQRFANETIYCSKTVWNRVSAACGSCEEQFMIVA